MRRIRAMGIRDKPIAPASPWQNGFAERLIGSIRRECLDHLVVLSEAHLRRILQAYAGYYNKIRTHRSLDKGCPRVSPGSTDRDHHITPDPWRASSSIRSGLGFRYTQHPQGGDCPALSLRQPRPAPPTPRSVPRRLQLHQAAQNLEGAHALRIHLQSLDKRTRSIQTQTYPAHLGTAHLAFSGLLEKQTPATGTDRRSRLPVG